MDDPEEVLLLHIDAWLSPKEEMLASGTVERPAGISKLMEKTKDEAFCQYLADATDARILRSRIDAIRLQMEVGRYAEAMAGIRLFDNTRDHIMGLIQKPYLVTGRKLLDRPNKGGHPKERKLLSRDVEMAREYQRRLQMPSTTSAKLSSTVLMADIGKKKGLGRSTAIEAIKRGLQKVSG